MSFAHFHFAEPRWLWLVVVAPVLLALLHAHAARKRSEQLAKIVSPNFAEQFTHSHSPARRRVKEISLLFALAFAGLALARPQWGHVDNANVFIGEDIVFVLDCSQSMMATDVAPSRMQRAKFALLDFVQQQNHGRVGLVAFAGSAFLQCPLTFDLGAFEETLLGLDEKTIPLPGTDLGRALTEASRAMDKNARRKMVVLITDGEDLEKSGVLAARQLATNGVVVFALGVGTPSGKEIQIRNAAGELELVRDAQGQAVRSRLDEATLREIARLTGGNYFPLGATGEGLAQVRAAMHTLETGGTAARSQSGVDRYHFPLTAMLLLLAVEPVLSTRRKNVGGGQ